MDTKNKGRPTPNLNTVTITKSKNRHYELKSLIMIFIIYVTGFVVVYFNFIALSIIFRYLLPDRTPVERFWGLFNPAR